MWKKVLIPSGVLIGLFLVLSVIILAVVGISNSCKDTVNTETPMLATGGSSGGWKDSGSKVHKNMQYALERFKKMGFSGDQIATVLAIGWKESNFDPTIVNPGGGVVGIFQWGKGGPNGNRYGNTQDTVQSQMDLTERELNGAYKGVQTKLLSAKSMAEAEEAWNVGYEGLPAGDAAQRKSSQIMADAQSIKQTFKLDFAAQKHQSQLSQDAKDNATLNATTTADDAKALGCGTPAPVGGQSSGAPVKEVPAKYKDKIKFDNKRSTTYPDNRYPFGQCTWYVYNRMKQTGHPVPWFSGDGGNGGNWGETGKQHGLKVQPNKPEVGWAVSFKGGQYGALGPYGHIAFVEYVNDDGSFLVSECNVVNGGSGTISFREFKNGNNLTFIQGK
ncbi:CHAP domain-containing protein [Weissella viridescens]|uniref:CHAP domain-containing protein n=1 Tax=Weissella viridescens TaxID=1629 RepID=A0A3P2RCE5_WEIVI|nr:phage tail tip lysozyme [Weissella viridescens]RRG17446.1 CHAP domain-containing protein [Weissella viridescens]